MSVSLYCESLAATPNQFQSNILVEFGARLRGMRRARNLSEVELAWEAGISRAHLEDIETGNAHVDISLIAQIALAMGLTLSALMETL